MAFLKRFRDHACRESICLRGKHDKFGAYLGAPPKEGTRFVTNRHAFACANHALMKSAAETTRLPALRFDVVCVAILRVIAAITIQILASLLWLTSAWGWARARAATRTETTR